MSECLNLKPTKSTWRSGAWVGLYDDHRHYLIVNDGVVLRWENRRLVRAHTLGAALADFQRSNRAGGSWHICQ